MYRMTTGAYRIAEITLSYQNVTKLSDRPKVTQSKDAYPIFLEVWDADKIGFVEEVKLLLLNQANRVLGFCNLSMGGVTGTVCDPKLVFAAALKANACNLILAHNHPSENVTPSRADKALTEKIKQAGETMDITMLDHLIISPHSYYSFADDATHDRKDLGIAAMKEDDTQEKHITMAAEARVATSHNTQTMTAAYLQKDIIARALTRSELSYDALLTTWQQNTLDMQQSFRMFSLDKACRILSLHTLPQDTRCDSHEDVDVMLSLAQKDNAALVVLAQNKPYGVILPKVADLDFAEMFNAAGRDHDIVLLDYLFVSKNGYYSYNDNEFHLAAAKPRPV